MGYDGKLLHRAKSLYDVDKQARLANYVKERELIYIRRPRLRAIDNALAGTMGRIIASALRQGANPLPAIDALRDENLGLQSEKQQILQEMGLKSDALDEKPACPICDDNGYRGGVVCQCLKAYYVRLQKEELSTMLDLGKQSFDTFSLDWYPRLVDSGYGISPRTNMERVLKTCKNFAQNFHVGGGNLLLSGGPGLGKTFLSAAMAREVSEGGHSVVYDTAMHVFEQFEAQKFGRDEGEDAQSAIHRILHCDLLILDDLGTEMVTAFVQSALYQIVNTRLVNGCATVLNSNLSPEQIARRYSPQIASRIYGEYTILAVFGEDIRLQKRNKR